MDEKTGKKQNTGLSYGQFIQRTLAVVGIVTAVGLLLLLVWFSVKIWLAVFAGILLAVFLRGLGDWVAARTRLPALWALALVVTGLLGVGALVGWLLAPDAVQQFHELADRLPKAIDQLNQRLLRIEWVRYLSDKLPAAPDLGAEGGKLFSKLGGFFAGGIQALTGLVLILFLGVYLAAAPDVYIGGLLHLFPASRRARIREVLGALGATLRNWLLGQLLSMVVVGILIGLGLKLLKIPLPVALGVLAGIFDFIPLIGPLFSAIPAVLLAFLIAPWQAVYVVALYLLVNTVIESHLIVPLIQRYTVSLPPALTVLALVLMGELFGFLGVLLAIPIAATLLVLVKMAYVQDVLGDQSTEESGQRKPK